MKIGARDCAGIVRALGTPVQIGADLRPLDHDYLQRRSSVLQHSRGNSSTHDAPEIFHNAAGYMNHSPSSGPTYPLDVELRMPETVHGTISCKT